MPLNIIREDILNMRTDAVVNPSNPKLKAGGGVSHLIFKNAGRDKLQSVCNELAPINIGEAVITPSFDLPFRYIIHVAGPVYNNKDREGSVKLLRDAYTNALILAKQNRCKSIAFPLLSSGLYRFPKDDALIAAREAIQAFLFNNDMDVYLLVYDKASFKVSKELLGKVNSYIDENYVDDHSFKPVLRRHRFECAGALDAPGKIKTYKDKLSNDVLLEKESAELNIENKTPAFKNKLQKLKNQLDEPFSNLLMQLIDEKGKSDAEVYKKANIDRKLFSKIRSIKNYTPTKPTILALAISLELSLPETENLLRRAGYALSHSNIFDVIIEFFIKQNKYNIFEINEVLFEFEQPLLGSKKAN